MKRSSVAAVSLAIAIFAAPGWPGHAARAETLGVLRAAASSPVKLLAPGIYVTGRLAPDDMAKLKAEGVASVVDLLPDAETTPGSASEQMKARAAAVGLSFAFIPTEPGAIPAANVDALSRALAQGGRPVALYCRSGNRAAHVWALSEASHPGGIDASAIARAAAAAGYSVADIAPEIARRVAAR
jgi:uncharacterized protein (TIGR01244 family)